MNQVRLLIVEDSEDDAQIFVHELRRGGLNIEFDRVETADAMRAALQAREWDVIVSDYTMPAFSGLAALSVLKETGLDIPLIIVSGKIGEETAVEALRAGAVDFLVKGRLARLGPAIAREMREAEGRRERRAAERALEETRDRMQFALDAAGVGIWESDIRTGKMVWSDVLEHLHGVPMGEFRGTFQAFIDCIHPDDRQAVLDDIARSTRERTDSRIEYRTIWPDESTHWVIGLGRTFYADTAEPLRAVGIGLDITGRKTLEEQVLQTQKLESIGGLAAGIAHDFNNLLTIIVAYSGMLAERLANDPDAMEEIEEIRRAGASATALTRQLLAFSRKQRLEPTVASVNEILTDSHKMLQRLVEENVRIDLRLDPGLARVKVDRGLLEQVIMNLAANARDAMPNGGVISIETRNVELDGPYASAHVGVQAGSYVLLSVSDTGVGMTPAVQARLFEPFFTTKERGRGTGLGLATVHGIVKQSGGHVSVYSEVGIGTTFKVYLPVTAESGRPVQAEPKETPNASRGSETILVVEDSAQLRGLTARILKRHGYTVLVASSAQEASRISADHPGSIHVVLTDVVMPGGDGRALSELLAERRPEAKIIYMSGYTDDAIARHGVLDASVPFLPKPFSAEELIDKIRAVLR